ncbi:Lysine exporter protein (LYSE/YGGA) [Actinobacteria bacterium OV450]|nr:Lysine exporter protein (LYSE/YGGA) [Actinobacteria bacterium OV450]
MTHSATGRAQTAVDLPAAAPAGSPWRTGLVSNLFNLKIAVFYTGLLPMLALPGLSPHAGMALLVLLHAMLTALWLGSYVLLLAKARAFFQKPSARRAMDRITGVVLIGFGIKVAMTHYVHQRRRSRSGQCLQPVQAALMVIVGSGFHQEVPALCGPAWTSPGRGIHW